MPCNNFYVFNAISKVKLNQDYSFAKYCLLVWNLLLNGYQLARGIYGKIVDKSTLWIWMENKQLWWHKLDASKANMVFAVESYDFSLNYNGKHLWCVQKWTKSSQFQCEWACTKTNWCRPCSTNSQRSFEWLFFNFRSWKLRIEMQHICFPLLINQM